MRSPTEESLQEIIEREVKLILAEGDHEYLRSLSFPELLDAIDLELRFFGLYSHENQETSGSIRKILEQNLASWSPSYLPSSNPPNRHEMGKDLANPQIPTNPVPNQNVAPRQSLLEMSKDLVKSQILAGQLSVQNVNPLLQRTYATMKALQLAEEKAMPNEGISVERLRLSRAWQSSIQRHHIICLECGKKFKQLGARHLASHDLDPRSYRMKYHIPRTQALSAQAVTARRRELAQKSRPWEKSASARSKPVLAKSKSPSKRRRTSGPHS